MATYKIHLELKISETKSTSQKTECGRSPFTKNGSYNVIYNLIDFNQAHKAGVECCQKCFDKLNDKKYDV